QLNVFEGERLEKGDAISDGPLVSQDILRLKGIAAVADYLVQEVQDVYRLQGVRIDDRHIELILRQMLRRAVITDGGDSLVHLPGETAEVSKLRAINSSLL